MAHVDGAVFDLDGTLTDNLEQHSQAFARLIERHGLPALSEQDYVRMAGRRNSEIFPDLFGRRMGKDEVSRLADEKESLYRELSRGALRPLGGLGRLLDELDARRIRIAVATSAPAANVVHSLAELGLATRLTTIVRGDEVPHGKPAPDIFLRAAELLEAAPQRCVAFEDAPAGLLAAARAGMRGVAITTAVAASDLVRDGIPFALAVADFDEFFERGGLALLD
jgi:HAD superfamily hydrolase (TIGR01509 family)